MGMPSRDDISRRDLFRIRGGFLRRIAEAAGEQASPRPVPTSLTLLQRPPGAVAEGQFLAACTRCGDCIDVCPPRAIIKAPEAAGNRAGTPMIDALRSPCVMCDDLPCIDACEPGVLRHDLPVKMAHASVDESLCLAWQGQECNACVDNCPVDGALSVLEGEGESTGPRVDSAACTGCGVCRCVCPAPQNAIRHRPVDERPFAAL